MFQIAAGIRPHNRVKCYTRLKYYTAFAIDPDGNRTDGVTPLIRPCTGASYDCRDGGGVWRGDIAN